MFSGWNDLLCVSLCVSVLTCVEQMMLGVPDGLEETNVEAGENWQNQF